MLFDGAFEGLGRASCLSTHTSAIYPKERGIASHKGALVNPSVLAARINKN